MATATDRDLQDALGVVSIARSLTILLGAIKSFAVSFAGGGFKKNANIARSLSSKVE